MCTNASLSSVLPAGPASCRQRSATKFSSHDLPQPGGPVTSTHRAGAGPPDSGTTLATTAFIASMVDLVPYIGGRGASARRRASAFAAIALMPARLTATVRVKRFGASALLAKPPAAAHARLAGGGSAFACVRLTGVCLGVFTGPAGVCTGPAPRVSLTCFGRGTACCLFHLHVSV